MKIVEENRKLILTGLIATYSDPAQKNTWAYLPEDKLAKILDNIIELGNEDMNIEQYIDDVLVNGYGFDENGMPLQEPEEEINK